MVIIKSRLVFIFVLNSLQTMQPMDAHTLPSPPPLVGDQLGLQIQAVNPLTPSPLPSPTALPGPLPSLQGSRADFLAVTGPSLSPEASQAAPSASLWTPMLYLAHPHREEMPSPTPRVNAATFRPGQSSLECLAGQAESNHSRVTTQPVFEPLNTSSTFLFPNHFFS